MKLEIWNGSKTYITPIGGVQTPADIAAKYPATTVPGMTFVIETDNEGQVALSEPMNLAALKSHYGVDAGLGVEEAVAAIEEIMNAPQPEPEVSAEERIAAAMEFQNLMMM